MTKNIITRNFTKGRPQGFNAPFIIMHTYNGAGRSLKNWFQENNMGVSAHYAVFLDGEGEQYVEEKNTAHHAGNWWANCRSVGIEHQDNGNPSDVIRTPEIYEASAQLCGIICKRYNIAANISGIKRHKEFASTGCPGGLDVGRIIRRVQDILHNEDDKYYRVSIKDKQQGAFVKKYNAFNLWYTLNNAMVIYKNEDITFEFIHTMNVLTQQITNLEESKNKLNEELAEKELELLACKKETKTANDFGIMELLMALVSKIIFIK